MVSLWSKPRRYSLMRDCCPSLTRSTAREKNDGSASAWTSPAALGCLPHVSRNIRAERDYPYLFSTEGDSTRKQGLRETKTMKKEYDFSKAERGRFYRKGAKLRLPIYLDAKLQNQVEELANRTGRDVGD